MLTLARNTLRLVCALNHSSTALSLLPLLQGIVMQFMQPLYVMAMGVSTDRRACKGSARTTGDARTLMHRLSLGDVAARLTVWMCLLRH